MRIIADDKIPFLKGALEPVAEVIYLPGDQIGPADVKDADALIIRTRTKCNSHLLEGSKVKFIATATIGFDHIDTSYCVEHGIHWQNAPGCNAKSVEQYILSALLTLAVNNNFELAGKAIGIIGVGHVGSKVERVCKLLGMNVLLNDPPRARTEGGNAFVSLDRIMQDSDIVTLHVPLNYSGEDSTWHFINNLFFSSLGKKIILINASRGEVVDGRALKQAIGAGAFEYVVLDVWENEPLIDLELLWRVNVATPHIAGYSIDGKANGTRMSVHGISEFFNLGMHDWEPTGLPVPEKTEIDIDGSGMNLQQILYEAVSASYNVMEDDKRLRDSANTFEKQRGAYPVRREFGSFSIRLKNDRAGAGQLLRKLGFNILK
ncbi:MAG: 4-phosphoerythronate dehydrogenase PdxB [Bacteroidales bacterium]|nr:4-phosphoerythronate dehydrogenase PdxB [Bacteroidales bacterium]